MKVAIPDLRRHSRRSAITRAAQLTAALAAIAGLVAAAWTLPAAASPAATAGLASLRAAAARHSVPGVTPTSVLIGSDQPLTGLAAPGFSEIAPASNAVFEFVNAHGGVRGRSIHYMFLDDATDPATAAADENQLVSADHVFSYFEGFGVTEHAAIVGSLNAQGVPDLLVSSSCGCWNEPVQRPETFGAGPDFTVEGRELGHYVARTFPAAKVGYVWENSSALCCKQGVAGLDNQIPAARVVTRQSFSPGELAADRLLPQVEAARAAGVQVLVLDTIVPQATALVLLDAAGLGYHPRILVAQTLSADPVLVGGFLRQFSGGKASPALENGLITQDDLPSASDTANPWIALFHRIHDTYEPKEPFDDITVYAMASAFTFTQALRAAGSHPTRRSIVAALNSGAVDFGGPGVAPFDFSHVNHGGYAGQRIGIVENGGITLSGPVSFTHDTGPILTLPPSTARPPHRF
jgi:ABC-type branched-subunit amino acid transport system substrate-binding protein